MTKKKNKAQEFKLDYKKANEWFEQPTINKSGFCVETGVTLQYLLRVLHGQQPMTYKLTARIYPTMVKYGFKYKP